MSITGTKLFEVAVTASIWATEFLLHGWPRHLRRLYPVDNRFAATFVPAVKLDAHFQKCPVIREKFPGTALQISCSVPFIVGSFGRRVRLHGGNTLAGIYIR